MRAHGVMPARWGSPSRGAPCLDAKNDGGDVESRGRVSVRQECRRGWPQLQSRQSLNRKEDERNRDRVQRQSIGVRDSAARGHFRSVQDIDTAARWRADNGVSITRSAAGRAVIARSSRTTRLLFIPIAAAEGRQLGARAAIGVCAAKPGPQHSGTKELKDHDEGNQDGQVAPHVVMRISPTPPLSQIRRQVDAEAPISRGQSPARRVSDRVRTRAAAPRVRPAPAARAAPGR